MEHIEIKIVSLRTKEECDKMEINTKANYCIKNKKTYIIYKEEDTTNTIIVDEDSVTINKKGNNVLKLVFIKGKTTNSILYTQYGNFDIRVITNDMKIDTQYIYIDYDIYINEGYEGNTKLSITRNYAKNNC